MRSKIPSTVLFVCSMLASARVGVAAERAAMFGSDAAHSGIYAGRSPRQLRLKWTFDPRASASDPVQPIFSSPVVANGTLYIGSCDNRLYALDPRTGRKKWAFQTMGGPAKAGANITSSPAVADGRVYFLCADGNFYALDAATGARQWTFATGGERRFTAAGINGMQPLTQLAPDPWDFYTSSPAVADGTVYFGCGDTYVYALEAATGALRWKFRTGDVVHASPAVIDGRVYIGSFDTYFYALDARTGAVAWKFKTGDDPKWHNQTGLPGSATVADGTVYFGCRDANLYALDAASGALRWKFPNQGSWVVATPVVADGVVYFGTSDSKKFEALDAKTGAELYSLPTGIFVFSSPALADGRAYFGAFDGRLHAVDLKTRTYVAEFAVPGYREHAAAYLTEKGELKDSVWTGETLDDVTLALYNRVFSLGSILSSPAIEDGTVYFGSVDGKVYAVGD